MFPDFVVANERGGFSHGSGPVGEYLESVAFDPGMLRPFIDDDGQKCVTINTGKWVKDEKTGRKKPLKETVRIKDLRDNGIDTPVWNAMSLRKDDWIQIDDAVIPAARQRLRAWADLAAANRVGGFNAMAKMTYEYESMSDPGEAIVDMEGLADARGDEPYFKLRSIPLPITHSGWWYSRRRLLVSQNSNTPLSTTMPEACGRRVAEMVEKTTIGVETGVAYGPTASSDTRYDNTSQVYGYTNFPDRMTKTDLTTPTGTNPEAVKQDVIEMREQMYAAGFYGPFMVYYTPAYDAFFDDDYFRTGATTGAMAKTLRQRILEIGGIIDLRRLDYWTGSTYQMVMVQMTSNIARAIDGMGITTIQWESLGGMKLNFKVLCIQVPLLQSDYNNDTGILHATTS